jgi:hypothetical protein
LKTDLSVASFGVQYAPVPDVVKQPGAVKSISAGKIHTLAILTNGSLVQWGRKESATPPPEVETATNIRSVLFRLVVTGTGMRSVSLGLLVAVCSMDISHLHTRTVSVSAQL